ncbi:hypothetical protein NPIL_398091, partial [Nephila pilipes]
MSELHGTSGCQHARSGSVLVISASNAHHRRYQSFLAFMMYNFNCDSLSHM